MMMIFESDELFLAKYNWLKKKKIWEEERIFFHRVNCNDSELVCLEERRWQIQQ